MSNIVVCEGVVLMNEDEAARMPCSPNGFFIQPWVFVGTFQRMEREEAAARILAHSQKLDTWVGVTWTRLVEMMQEDYAVASAGQELRRQNEIARLRTAALTRSWWTKSILTVGIYAIFVKKPAAATQARPPEIPTTGIFHAGPEFVAEGIHELIERDLIRHVPGQDEEGNDDVFFPTPALVTRILQVQRQQPATA